MKLVEITFTNVVIILVGFESNLKMYYIEVTVYLSETCIE